MKQRRAGEDARNFAIWVCTLGRVFLLDARGSLIWEHSHLNPPRTDAFTWVDALYAKVLRTLRQPTISWSRVLRQVVLGLAILGGLALHHVGRRRGDRREEGRHGATGS
jgi:hypothetical protein